MFSKLLPQQTDFFDFFTKHANIISQSAQLFFQLVTVDEIQFVNNLNPMKILEHEADQITYHCMEQLHRSFITPFQQEDIFRLISRMDDIVDCIDETCENCLVYKIRTPTEEVKKLAHLLMLASECVKEIVSDLPIRHKKIGTIRQNCITIRHIENEADREFRSALGNLFEREENIRLVIKWKEIYSTLEQSIDHCQEVANIIEGLLLEYD